MGGHRETTAVHTPRREPWEGQPAGAWISDFQPWGRGRGFHRVSRPLRCCALETEQTVRCPAGQRGHHRGLTDRSPRSAAASPGGQVEGVEGKSDGMVSALLHCPAGVPGWRDEGP